MRSGEASGGFPALGSGKLYRSRGLAAIGKHFARRAALSGSVHLIRHAEASVDEQDVAGHIVELAARAFYDVVSRPAGVRRATQAENSASAISGAFMSVLKNPGAMPLTCTL